MAEDPMTEDPGQPSGAVVVGFDGSIAATCAVDWAADQAELTGGRLELVSAWQYPTSWGNVIPLPSDFDPAADTQAMLDPVVEHVTAEHPRLQVRTHVVEGRAAEVLVEASRHAALLVVASRGHGSLPGLVLGSVSLRCVTHAACPVVVHRRPAGS